MGAFQSTFQLSGEDIYDGTVPWRTSKQRRPCLLTNDGAVVVEQAALPTGSGALSFSEETEHMSLQVELDQPSDISKK
jgi:hypothetical protein